MWVAVFKVWHEGSIIIDASRELEVVAYAHYLNAVKRGKKTYINRVVFIHGKDAARYMREMQRDPRIEIVKTTQNQVFYRTERAFIFQHRWFDENVFSIKPIMVRRGFAYWTIAAFEKSHILGLYKKIKKLEPKAKIDIISIAEKEVNFFTENIFFKLTDKQRAVLLEAWKRGYFSYPRKIDVQGLSRLVKTPRSSLQYLLRKAENELINGLLEEVA